MAAAVPSEHEPVQIPLEVLPVQAVAGPHGLALQVRENPVGPLQDLVRLAVADHVRLARVAWQAAVPAPTVGYDPCARLERIGNEPVERVGAVAVRRSFIACYCGPSPSDRQR